MVKQSHPGGSQEFLGIGFGVGPEKRPCLQRFGGDPDDGVVLGAQVRMGQGDWAGLGATSVDCLAHVAAHAACGWKGSAEGWGSIRLHGLDSRGGEDRGPLIVSVSKGSVAGTFSCISDALAW